MLKDGASEQRLAQSHESRRAREIRTVAFTIISGFNLCASLSCLLILFFYVLPQLHGSRSVVRTERLLLGPAGGPILAAIGESEAGSVEFSVRASNAKNAPFFRVILDQSSARMCVGTSESPIALSSREGQSEIVVGASPNSSAVKLFRSVDTAGLMTMHPDSDGRSAILSSGKESKVVLFDPEGTPRVGMGVGEKGPAIALQDATERPRLGFSVLGGESQFFIQDASGSPLVSLHQAGEDMSFRVKPGAAANALTSVKP